MHSRAYRLSFWTCVLSGAVLFSYLLLAWFCVDRSHQIQTLRANHEAELGRLAQETELLLRQIENDHRSRLEDQAYLNGIRAREAHAEEWQGRLQSQADFARTSLERSIVEFAKTNADSTANSSKAFEKVLLEKFPTWAGSLKVVPGKTGCQVNVPAGYDVDAACDAIKEVYRHCPVGAIEFVRVTGYAIVEDKAVVDPATGQALWAGKLPKPEKIETLVSRFDKRWAERIPDWSSVSNAFIRPHIVIENDQRYRVTTIPTFKNGFF